MAERSPPSNPGGVRPPLGPRGDDSDMGRIDHEPASDDDPLVERLRRFGQLPVAETVAVEHLAALRADTGSGRRRWRPIVAAGAATVVVLAGSAGLAAADLLPDPAQGVAHDVLDRFGVDVPDRGRGDCLGAALTDDTPPGGDHGELSSQAAREDCDSPEEPEADAPADDAEPVADGVPSELPAVPVGPPDGVPDRPSDGTPQGPPADVPQDPPAGTPPEPVDPPVDVPPDPPVDPPVDVPPDPPVDPPVDLPPDPPVEPPVDVPQDPSEPADPAGD